MSRYRLRFGLSRLPSVEVLEGEEVVQRLWGVSTTHAYRRALAWARRNGDSR